MAHTPTGDHDPVADLQRFLSFANGTAQAWQHEVSRAETALRRLEVAADSGSAPLQVESLTVELTRVLLPDLVASARGAVRSYVMELDGGPAGTGEVSQAIAERNRTGRPLWTLYPSTMLATAEGIALTASRAAEGEVQRVCPSTQTQFIVIADELVISAAVWGDPGHGYLLVRHPLVVAAFRAYFDASWTNARLLTHHPEVVLGDERLLELLGHGLKDEAIARVMGLGLRTVRRRIAALMAVHGVETRFQLGASLERAALERAERALPGTTG